MDLLDWFYVHGDVTFAPEVARHYLLRRTNDCSGTRVHGVTQYNVCGRESAESGHSSPQRSEPTPVEGAAGCNARWPT